MDTVMQSLQDLVDRRAMESVQASKARGHSEIEAARWYQTTLLTRAIEKLMDAEDKAFS